MNRTLLYPYQNIAQQVSKATHILKAFRPSIESRFWIGFIFQDEYWRTPEGKYLPFAHSQLPNRRKSENSEISDPACAQLRVNQYEKIITGRLQSVTPCDTKRSFICEIFSPITTRGPRLVFEQNNTKFEDERNSYVDTFHSLSYFKRIGVPQTTWNLNLRIQVKFILRS